MSLAVVATVLIVFFLIGVAVGVIVVFAMSARRADKAEREEPSPEEPPAGWPYAGQPDSDDEEPGRPPWWQDRGDP